jgi:hypothetical protein
VQEPDGAEVFAHTSEAQRAVRAVVLGALLGVVLALIGARRAAR